MSPRRLLILVAFVASASALPMLADELLPSAPPPAKLAPGVGMSVPIEFLTLPAALRPAPGLPSADRSRAPVRSGRLASDAMRRAGTSVSIDANRSRPKLPAISDGDRDHALLVRLSVPF